MTDHTAAAQAANTNQLSDEYVNAVIQRHGYDSPESVIAQLHQWLGLHGRKDSVTLLMYEAHKALSKLRAPVADERVAFEAVDGLVPPCASRRGNDFREGYLEAKVDALRLLRALASAPVAPQACPTDVCQAGQADGVLCANDECDRANGVRPASAPVAEPKRMPVDDGICWSSKEIQRRQKEEDEARAAYYHSRASAPVAGEAKEDLAPPKCPITGRPFFMAIEHPELGMVPTYGGPYDSYTIPHLDGKPDQPRHERELYVYRYDHDLGGWRTDEVEVIPLRIVHEDVLHELQDAAPQASEAVRILFPTHLRKMWSGGEVQAWLDEHQGVTAPKPSAKGSLERYRKWQAERDEAFGAGVKAAADLIKKMVDDYDADLGSTDPATGSREYPGEGATWVCEMQELEESIRALSAQPGAQKEGGNDA